MNAIETLLTNAEVIIGQEELEKRISAGKRLKVKFGVDPTRPDLTLGHMVVFEKLRQFQEMGHEAILLIGDYTAQIGDPSGRSALRPVLTANEVETNPITRSRNLLTRMHDSAPNENFFDVRNSSINQ